MRQSTLRKNCGAALVILLAVTCVMVLKPVRAGGAAQPVGSEKSDSGARKLEGTWLLQITLRNCETGAVVRTVQALNTYTRGGELIETTAAASPARRGPGHGVWGHVGGHSFESKLVAFLFDPSGNFAGTQRITATHEFGDDPDSFTGTAAVEFRDAAGNPTQTLCATSAGRRFE